MTCLDDYEIKPPIYGVLMKKNKCTCNNNKLENGVMSLNISFHFNVINAYIMYAK